MSNLNLENFWNPQKENTPLAVEYFCGWIDGYKKNVGWRLLFRDGIKFHDIPLELQIGILRKYIHSCIEILHLEIRHFQLGLVAMELETIFGWQEEYLKKETAKKQETEK